MTIVCHAGSHKMNSVTSTSLYVCVQVCVSHCMCVYYGTTIAMVYSMLCSKLNYNTVT